MISGNVIRKAAVDLRFIALRKLERRAGDRVAVELPGCNATSAMLIFPVRFASRRPSAGLAADALSVVHADRYRKKNDAEAAARFEAGRRRIRARQLRMKPSHSPSAQARVFSIASPW